MRTYRTITDHAIKQLLMAPPGWRVVFFCGGCPSESDCIFVEDVEFFAVVESTTRECGSTDREMQAIGFPFTQIIPVSLQENSLELCEDCIGILRPADVEIPKAVRSIASSRWRSEQESIAKKKGEERP